MAINRLARLRPYARRRRNAAGVEPGWLRGISGLSSGLNRIAAAVAALLLVLMTGHILLEIVLRAFSRSTFMADALVGYGVAAITFLAMAWALEQHSMIRVQVITQRLTGRARWAAEFFAIVSALWLSVFLAYYQWPTLARAWTRGTVSEHFLPVPLWIPEALFFVGLLLLALQFTVRLLTLFVHGVRQDTGLVL